MSDLEFTEADVTFTYGQTFSPPTDPVAEAEELLTKVARRHGIGPRDIRGRGRMRHVAHARQEVMWRLRNEMKPGWSLPRIARFLGNRDHTTILYGCRQHEARMKEAENG